MGWAISAAVAGIVSGISSIINTAKQARIKKENAENQATADYEQAKTDQGVYAGKMEGVKNAEKSINLKYSGLEDQTNLNRKQNLGAANAQAGASGFAYAGTDRNREASINDQANKAISTYEANNTQDINAKEIEYNNLKLKYDEAGRQMTFAAQSMPKVFDLTNYHYIPFTFNVGF